MIYKTAFLLLFAALALTIAQTATPKLNSIATAPKPPVKGEPFVFAVTGAGMDPATTIVTISGPGCDTPCSVGGLAVTPTQASGNAVLSGGRFTVTARNGSGGSPSNALPLEVGTPSATVPHLTSVKTSPDPMVPGQPFSFSIVGSGFDPATAVVLFAGPGCTEPCSGHGLAGAATELHGATVLTGGTYTLTVRNDVEGAESNSISLAATATKAAAPHLSGIETAPNPPAKDMPFSFKITGSNLDATTAIATFSGPGCEGSCNVGDLTGSATELQGATVLGAGKYTLTLRNGNGGTVSNPVSLKVEQP